METSGFNTEDAKIDSKFLDLFRIQTTKLLEFLLQSKDLAH
jgi:hypothetical protein